MGIREQEKKGVSETTPMWRARQEVPAMTPYIGICGWEKGRIEVVSKYFAVQLTAQHKQEKWEQLKV